MDWGVRRVDGSSDSEWRGGSFCHGSKSEEESKGAEPISDDIAGSNGSRKREVREQKRSNSVA